MPRIALLVTKLKFIFREVDSSHSQAISQQPQSKKFVSQEWHFLIYFAIWVTCFIATNDTEIGQWEISSEDILPKTRECEGSDIFRQNKMQNCNRVIFCLAIFLPNLIRYFVHARQHHGQLHLLNCGNSRSWRHKLNTYSMERPACLILFSPNSHFSLCTAIS